MCGLLWQLEELVDSRGACLPRARRFPLLKPNCEDELLRARSIHRQARHEDVNATQSINDKDGLCSSGMLDSDTHGVSYMTKQGREAGGARGDWPCSAKSPSRRVGPLQGRYLGHGHWDPPASSGEQALSLWSRWCYAACGAFVQEVLDQAQLMICPIRGGLRRASLWLHRRDGMPGQVLRVKLHPAACRNMTVFSSGKG